MREHKQSATTTLVLESRDCHCDVDAMLIGPLIVKSFVIWILKTWFEGLLKASPALTNNVACDENGRR